MSLDTSDKQSLDSERAVLGASLISQEAMHHVVDGMRSEYFYWEKHALIFKAIASVAKNGPVDEGLVQEVLTRKKKFIEIGGILYLADLKVNSAIPSTVPRHIDVIKDHWRRRKLLVLLSQESDLLMKDPGDTSKIIDKLAQKIMLLTTDGSSDGPRIVGSDLDRVLDLIENPIPGVKTGFKVVDEVLSGFKPKEVTIVAARTSMGKTSFAIDIARHVGAEKQEAILFFTLEMSREQIIMRLLSSIAKINPFDVINHGNELSQDSKFALERAQFVLKESTIIIDDTPSISLSQIRYRARQAVQEAGIQLIVVDYLQLVKCDERADTREQEVARVAEGLKSIAKDLNVPVVALAQLSRETDKTKGNIPQLSHLRESGAIEQVADVVVFIHRPGYYGIGTVVDDGMDEINTDDLAQIIIAKHRSGPTPKEGVELQWNPQLASFEARR